MAYENTHITCQHHRAGRVRFFLRQSSSPSTSIVERGLASGSASSVACIFSITRQNVAMSSAGTDDRSVASTAVAVGRISFRAFCPASLRDISTNLPSTAPGSFCSIPVASIRVTARLTRDFSRFTQLWISRTETVPQRAKCTSTRHSATERPCVFSYSTDRRRLTRSDRTAIRYGRNADKWKGFVGTVDLQNRCIWNDIDFRCDCNDKVIATATNRQRFITSPKRRA